MSQIRVGFFFQAEDGIRDKLVTGVQTCALPISRMRARMSSSSARCSGGMTIVMDRPTASAAVQPKIRSAPRFHDVMRSEEHTSELQSLAYLVCRLLLEKKNEQIFNFDYKKDVLR